ncbi:MAG: hypothetical protein A3J83_03070, partial [Elusimicrobia bacterium RIFOXYA2_FULL_40_6]
YHNFISEYLILIIPMVFVLCLTEIKKYQKVMLWFAMALCLCCILLTKTRSAWLALSLSVIFVLFNLQDREKKTFAVYRKWVLIILGFFVLISLFILPFEKSIPGLLINRSAPAFNLEEGSTKSRLLIYESALRMIKDSPIMGKGIGVFGFHYPDYLSKVMERKAHTVNIEEVTEAHNEYLQVWAETGIFGLMIFLSIIVLYFKENTNGSYLTTGFFAGVLAVLIDSIFSFPLHIVPIAITFWIFLGLTAAFRNICLEKNGKSNSTAYTVGMKTTAFLVLISIGLLYLFGSTAKSYISDIYWKRALNFVESGDWKKSEDYYQSAVSLEPENGRLHFFFGSMLLNIRELDRGIDELNISLKNFKDYHLYHNLGKAYLDKKEYQQALQFYTLALKTKLNYIEDLNNIAAVYLENGHPEKAVKICRSILKMEGSYAPVYRNLGLAYMKSGLDKKANDVFNRAQCLFPKDSTFMNSMGITYINMGYYDKAIKCFEKILTLDSQNAQAYNNLGSVYFRKKDYMKAKTYWLTTLDFDPNNQVAIHNLQSLGKASEKRAD